MNIELLAREAISIIRNKWGLPSSGFVAGGSISNIVWELVSGNKAKINDIDIFIKSDSNNLIYKNEIRDIVYNDYDTIYSYRTTFNIVDVTQDGIYNNIYYNSCDNLQDIILSFDINCTQLGYSIDEDKVYYTYEFAEFLKSGKLLIVNIQNAYRSSIRICKKGKELNIKVDPLEYEILCYITHSYKEKNWLIHKYYIEYIKNISILSKYFTISLNIEKSRLLKENIYEYSINNIEYSNKINNFIKNINTRIDYSYNKYDFLSYIRCPDEHILIWEKLHYYFNCENYLDVIPSEDDINLLCYISNRYKSTRNTLNGFKISKQIEIIKKILSKFDIEVAIVILEKNIKFDMDDYIDLIIMELSTRKNHNYIRNKLNQDNKLALCAKTLF